MRSLYFLFALMVACALILEGYWCVGHASWPGPRLPFSIEQAARLTLAEYDLVVEAVVEEAQLTTIEQRGRCTWATDLHLRPTRQVWGVVNDPTLRVLSLSLHEEPAESRGCVIRRSEDGVPSPNAGQRGLFLLVCRADDSRQISDDLPTLHSADYDYLPYRTDGLITKHLLGNPFSWPYDEFVAEIERQARQLSVEEMTSNATAIVLARTGAYEDREVGMENNGVQWVRFPLDVERILRVKADSQIFLAVNAANELLPDRTEAVTKGILNRRLLRKLQALTKSGPSRILTFGRFQDESNLVPSGCGWFLVDQDEKVHLPGVAITNGKIASLTESLSEFERTLQ